MNFPIRFRAVLEPGAPNFMPTQTIVVPAEVLEALGGKAAKASSLLSAATRCGWGCCRWKAAGAASC